MKIRCIANTGESLSLYENKKLKQGELGRFGATSNTKFGIEISKEYLVMGMLLGSGSLEYLIDHDGYISAYPYPLFDVIDYSIPSTWFFRSVKSSESEFPYLEAIWGYSELVFDNSHFEKITKCNEEAVSIYFKKKTELENEEAKS